MAHLLSTQLSSVVGPLTRPASMASDFHLFITLQMDSFGFLCVRAQAVAVLELTL